MTKEEKDKFFEELEAMLDRADVAFKAQEKWVDFAKFIAKWVVDDNFQDNAEIFAELTCRKLYKLGIIEIDGDTYKLKED